MPNPFDQFDAPNPFDQFDPVVNPSAQSPANVQGVFKQIGASNVESLASAPAFWPRTLKALGSAISERYGLPSPAPIINAPQQTPDEALSAALPQPQNAGEEFARTYGGFPVNALLEKGRVGQNIAGGLGAAGGSYLGSQYGPIFGLTPDQGSISGAILGGYVGARGEGIRENAVKRQNLPSPQQVIGDTGASYDALRDANRSIVIPPDVMRLAKTSALDLLRQKGPAEENAKTVYGIIRGLDSDNGGTMADLINARKNLHAHQNSLEPDANVPAALMMSDLLDRFIGKMAVPGTLEQLQINDQNWAGGRTAQAVETRVAKAENKAGTENSGLNSGNKILSAIDSYINSRTNKVTGQVYMKPEDLKDLENARNLGAGQKVGRYLERAAGAGGGLGALAAGGVAAFGAGEANKSGYGVTGQDPLIGGLGIPLLATMGQIGFNRSVARSARNAEASILARTPYVQGIGGSPPAPLLSFPNIAARSLVFAAPALRRESIPADAY